MNYKKNIKLIYEDKYIIIINKPQYLSIKENHNCLLKIININFGNKENFINDANRIMNRLDKNTVGIVIISKNFLSYNNLFNQMIKKQIKRIYVSLTNKKNIQMLDTIITSVEKCKNIYNKVYIINNKYKKAAITKYLIVKENNIKKINLIKYELKTGRTHQIRAHMKYKKSTIYGDQKYYFYNRRKKNIQILQSNKLYFFHPISFKKIVLEIPIEKYMYEKN